MAGNNVISAVLTLRDQNFSSGMSSAANNANGLSRKIKHTGNTISRFSKSAVSNFKGVVGGIVGMTAAYVGVNAIKDLGVGMIEAAASAKAMNSQFDQVFAGMESAANSSLSNVANETGILSGRLKGSFLGIAAFAKTTGMDTAGALALTERATLAAADGAAFYDKNISSVTESLQSFLKGNFENDAALGISATETTRNAAANKAYGKSFIKLSEDQKQLTLLSMVEEGNKLSGAFGQAARETDGLENVLGNLRESWKLVKEKLGEPILGPAIKGMIKLTDRIGNVNTDAIVASFKKFGNVAKGAFNAVKPTLSWIKDTAIPGVKKAVELLGIGVLVLKDWAVDAFQNIKQRINENKPAIEGVRSVMEDLGTKALELKDWMLNAFESSKPALSWLKDEGLPLVVDGIAAVVEKATEIYNYINSNWNLISPIVYGVTGAIVFYKTAMGLAALATHGLTLGLIAMSVAQGAFNAVLAISPLGWVALAIGAVVAVGVALYQNWDTVIAKTQELWTWMKQAEGVVGVVISPIKDLIQTGLDLASNWDSTRGVWDNVWNLMKLSASDAVNSVIGGINTLIETINLIPGVNIPLVATVQWGDTKSTITKTSSKAKGPAIASFAVGTNRVDRNQVANIHKDEMIIPARQSRNLRNQGVTIDNIDKPSRGTTNSRSGGISFGDIHIHGTNMTTQQIANELFSAIKLRMSNM